MREVLEKRISALRQSVPGPINFVAAYCNACGRIEAGLTVDELAPKLEGWLIGSTQNEDFCPACRPKDEQWVGSFPKHR